MEKLMGLTDQETETDLLNISGYARGCASFVSKCNTPMSIAVQGDWGTGKSSFMKMVAKEIEDKDNITVINFNTWQYSRIDDDRLFLPMLKVLTKQLDEHYLNKKENKAKADEYKSYFLEDGGKGYIDLGGLVRLGISTYGSIKGGGLWAGLAEILNRAGGEDEEKEYDNSDYYEKIVSIRDKLQERIDVMTGAAVLENKQIRPTGNRSGRIVIFVDDLDRLRPASAVGLLEDMKNFMNCEGCVFVLALDHKLVQNGVKEKYGNDLDDTYARKFFEKIVQIPFWLPVNRYDTERYMENLLEQGGLSELLDADECVRTVEQFTDGNPREIKRALNAFRMSQEMEPENTPAARQRLFALLVLQATDEDLYNKIAQLLEFIPVKNEMYFEETDLGLALDEEWEDAHPGDIDNLNYLRSLYDNDDFGLREDIFHSTMLESGHLQKYDERDLVYEILTRYLQSKGMTAGRSLETGNNVTTAFTKDGKTIEVSKFIKGGHVNINFASLSGEEAETILQKLDEDDLIFKGKEKTTSPKTHKELYYRYFDLNDRESYIANDQCLYVREVKYDRHILLIIGDIVKEMLK